MIAGTASAPRGTFARGVHPPGRKHYAADAAIEIPPTPAQVLLPLQQHLGAPAEPVVKNRQVVAWGEVVARGKGFVSASVHSPVPGVVGLLSVATLPNGRHVPAIPVKTEGQLPAGRALWEEIFGGDWPRTGLEAYAPEKIVEAAREAGLVGMGGAAFPTHVKLARNEKRPVDTLVVNGCECEPYLTADYRLMLEAPAAVVSGALLAARASGASRILVAVEDNKPAAAEALRRASEGTPIEVKVLPTKYPMGGERQLVVAALGRTVPTGGLPLDVGVLVSNVGTAAALARAVLRGRPLTHRLVTVSGGGVARSANLLVPIGITYRELVEFCGGLTSSAAVAVAGGPMMGFALGTLEVPVTKGTSGLTVLTAEDVAKAEQTPCIRCGRCVEVCPLGLVPTRMALASRHRDWDLARRYHLAACCECGCCAYVCPAGLPLTQLIRTGKALMPRE